MSEIPPPHVAFRGIGKSQNSCNVSGGTHFCACRLFLCIAVALLAALIIRAGYLAGKANDVRQPLPNEDAPVRISKSLFHDRDSVLFYYEQGLRHNDPKGLFVLGVATRLRQEGSLPEEIFAPSVEQGDQYLLESANLGYPDAIQAIRCLSSHGMWSHSIPCQQ